MTTAAPRYQLPTQTSPVRVGETTLAILDVPPLRDEDDSLVVYTAMSRETKEFAWPGAALYSSQDGGAVYGSELVTSTETVMGRTIDALGDWSAANRWDTTNTLDIRLVTGTLSSATDAAVLNGANAIAVSAGDDWEIVQFATASLVSAGVWRVSRLLRGRKGTERVIGSHAPADRVVVLDSARLRMLSRQAYQRNAEVLYKGATVGQALSDVQPIRLTLRGRSLMPLSPAHVTMTRENDDDVVIDWVRRARVYASWNWATGTPLPLDEPSESYEVDVMDGSTVKRTLSATTTSVTYTAAQQTTDFGSVPASLTVRVYQMSNRVGRGWPAETTVTF